MMDRVIRVNLLIIKSMAKAVIHGQMAECIMGIGKIIRCMAKVNTPGQMAAATMANMSMTKKKDTASLSGLMAANLKDFGKMASKMGLGFTSIHKN